MRKNKEWSYFEFEVGRYLPEWGDDPKTFQEYKPIADRLVWYVFNDERGQIVPINIFEYNWIFLEELLVAKKKYSNDFKKFANHVRRWLSHEYWSRAEYETIITSWPPYINNEELERVNKVKAEREQQYGSFKCESINLCTGFKIDIYTQVMMNWDRFIDYLWNNKKLITKKKLGLEWKHE